MAYHTLVAIFGNHRLAEAALAELEGQGFNRRQVSVIGRRYEIEETAIGFHSRGDWTRFWGRRGAFWGNHWQAFHGRILIAVPGIGQLIVLGYLSAAVAAAVEGDISLGGMSMVGAALCRIGIPRDAAIRYERILRVDGFMIVAHGLTEDLSRARGILANNVPSSLELHVPPPAGVAARAAATAK